MKTDEQTKHLSLGELVMADPEILGGEPVFRGTRVPVASLFEHLKTDCPLDQFLECFPSVSRETAVAVLMGAQELTIERVGGRNSGPREAQARRADLFIEPSRPFDPQAP